jgi:hypothetical protein
VSKGVKAKKALKMGTKQRLPAISTFVIDRQCVYCEGDNKAQIVIILLYATT